MYKVNDNRSMKVVFCSHCILNQNAKLESIATWPGMITDVVHVIEKSGAGIVQMPCPEMIYEGIGRFDKSVEQYNCATFVHLCEGMADNVIEQIENYLQWGYQVPAILAVDGSPSCGYNLALSAPEWRGPVAGMQWQPSRYARRSGIFMDVLKKKMVTKKLNVPFLGVPEVPAVGPLDVFVETLEKTLAAED